jgi:XTP/dITP diphosphohydrolase
MTSLIFATNNQNKVDEIKNVVGDLYHIVSLKEAGIDIDIPEPHATLEDNAREKSQTIYSLTHLNCFSEDTGLETEALNGEPGVKSARYAGEVKSFDANIEKLLDALKSKSNRKAQFRTVISLILNGKEYLFEGICKGQIISFKKGQSGFGYDPIFVPDGTDKTFGEMTMEEKNIYSHRKKAVAQLLDFLSQNGKFPSQIRK